MVERRSRAREGKVLLQDGDIGRMAAAGMADGSRLQGRKRPQKGMPMSLNILRNIFDSLYDAVFIHSPQGKILDFNGKVLELYDIPREDAMGYSLLYDYSSPSNPLEQLPHRWQKVLAGEEQLFEWIARRPRDGSEFDVEVYLQRLSAGRKEMVLATVRDITERKNADRKLMYLSLHDSLTDLYNRAYFQQELSRLEKGRVVPVGLIICDVDGLKLVNDTMGHEQGDRLLRAAGSIIQEIVRGGDVVARIGGDEFAVIVPECDEDRLKEAAAEIGTAVEQYNKRTPGLPLSISSGYAIAHELPVNTTHLFKEADNAMYREKLHRSRSARSNIVHVLLNALEERDFLAQEHGERLQRMLDAFSRAAGVPESLHGDLMLFAQFHDIGKVGVPDRILYKEETLNLEEYDELKRHSEIGYRIAQSSPDLITIADWILKHHEWWNGKGYPLGLKEEEIPLVCRLMAIADAFDAMTSKRPYRNPVSVDEALAEIERCSGSHFDPSLVKIFLDMAERDPVYFQ